MRILPINNVTNYNKVCGPRKPYHCGITAPTECDSVSFGCVKKPVQLQKVVILLGAPNSGKGTYARKIAERFSIPQISTGDILRGEVKKGSALGLEAKKYMESGGLVPDELIMKIFNKRITQSDCKAGFILDGFPRTIAQAEKLDETLKGLKNADLKIVNLDVDKAILYERSAKRYTCPDCSRVYAIKDFNPETSKCECGAKLIKRSDDTPEVLTKRLESYEKQTFPLIDYYGEKVSHIGVHGKDAPAEETLERVLDKLN